MGFLVDLLTLPLLGGPRLVHWLARAVAEQAEHELLDEQRVLGRLLELQERYEAGEVTEGEVEREEEALLDMLETIREAKEKREQWGRVA
ncbi:MAG: gas vesicle protein GvpG [Deltaproteobacteria bacterium]|nr:gas vesicle protein GvpG [Deltaproteobacteria bacterium]